MIALYDGKFTQVDPSILIGKTIEDVDSSSGNCINLKIDGEYYCFETEHLNSQLYGPVLYHVKLEDENDE